MGPTAAPWSPTRLSGLTLLLVSGWLGCTAPSRDQPLRAAFVAIDSLRVAGDYDAAQAVIRAVDRSGPEATRWPWRVREAVRLEEALARILALSPAERAQVAEADATIR